MLLLLSLLACADEPLPQASPDKPAVPYVKPDPEQPFSLPVQSGKLDLVQTKNGNVEVPASIEGVTGALVIGGSSVSGDLTIDVGTWASGLDARDANVRGTFFRAGQRPNPTFKLEAIDGLPADLAIGASAKGAARGALTFPTGSAPVQGEVTLLREAADRYVLSTVTPLTVSISALGLGEDLAALIKLCAHESVGDEVKIAGSVTFAAPK